MIQLQPLREQNQPFFSLDHRLVEIAVGEVKIFQVVSDEHPRVSVGDLLVLDEMRLAECDEKELLLIKYQGSLLLRQKHAVEPLLKRAGLHIIGSERQGDVTFVGRVIGWMHR